MDHDQDFSKLRNLLALKKLETPMNTEVDRFLIEFHRRQRAQLLVPASRWTLAMQWVKEKFSGIELVPSLSYASGFAVIALIAVLGLSQQVQVTHAGSGQYQLSFHMPSSRSSFALIPASFSSTAAKADNLNFTPTRSDSTAPASFVLTGNTRLAYDANVAF